MLGWLLSLVLSWVAALAGPGVLAVGALYLLLTGRKPLATILGLVAAVWFLSGILYQEGAGYVQAQVDAAVAAERKRQDERIAEALKAERDRAVVRGADVLDLQLQVAAYQEELARRPAGSSCVGTDADFDRLRKLLGE